MGSKFDKRARKKAKQFGNKQQFKKHKKSVVKNNEGFEYKGFPFAGQLGEYYQNITSGITDAQAKMYLHELKDILKDTQTHQGNSTTKNQVKYLCDLISQTDKKEVVLSPQTEPEAIEEEPTLSVGDEIEVPYIEVPRTKTKDGKPRQNSFKPYKNMDYRVFIKEDSRGDVEPGEKVKIISENNNIYFTAVSVTNPPKPNYANDPFLTSRSERMKFLYNRTSGKQSSPVPKIDPEILKLMYATKSLEDLVHQYDVFTGDKFDNSMFTEDFTKEMLIQSVFSIRAGAFKLYNELGHHHKATPEGQKYLTIYAEAKKRYIEAKPIIDRQEKLDQQQREQNSTDGLPNIM